MKIQWLATLLLSSLVFSTHAQTVNITIEGLRNKQGVVALSVFTNQDQFAREKPVKRLSFLKTTAQAGVLKLDVKLEPGEYGIALLDDENKDGDMNYNWVGLPLEGFGFSNFVSTGMSRPVYSDFKFTVKPGENKVHIKMRYM